METLQEVDRLLARSRTTFAQDFLLVRCRMDKNKDDDTRRGFVEEERDWETKCSRVSARPLTEKNTLFAVKI